MTVTRHHVKNEFEVTAINAVAQTVFLAAVTKQLICTYVVHEITGAGVAAATVTCVPGANVDLYTDGVDTCNLAISAAGVVTVSRTLGADTFNARLFMVWI
jgi:hypothetical protein